MAQLTPPITAFRAQAFWVVVGDAITAIALVGASMVLARTISQQDMATFRQIIYLGPLSVGLLELGLSATVYRYYVFYGTEDRKVFIWKVLIGISFLSVVGFLTLFFGAPLIARAFNNPSLESALKICSAYPVVTMPFMLVRPILISKGYSLRATSWEAIFSAGTAGSLAYASWRGVPLNEALVIWMAVHTTRITVTAWYLGKELKHSRPEWVPRIIRELWRYTWPLQLSRFPSLTMVYFDKVVTSVMLSSREFAAYALGARELPLVGGIAFSISSVLTPRMVKACSDGKTDDMYRYWHEAALATAIGTYPVAAFCVWHAKDIIGLLFTQAYIEAAIPFTAFSCITFLRVVEYGSMAKAMGNTKIIFYGSVIVALSALIISVPLTYFGGIRGISFSLLISNVLMVVYYMVRYSKLLKTSVHKLLPLSRLLALIFWSFVSVAGTDYLLTTRLHIVAKSNELQQAAELVFSLFVTYFLFFLPIGIICRKRIGFFIKSLRERF